MNNWQNLNHDQKVLELKRQRAILGLEGPYTFQQQQELLSRAREIIKKLNGDKFAPAEIEEDIGINQQALIIECQKAGYEESTDTRSLVPARHVLHVYELSAEAKAERHVRSLEDEIVELKAENIRLNKKIKTLSAVRKVAAKNK